MTKARRVVFEDDALPHQIRIFFLGHRSGWIGVSCCCRKQNGGSYAPLESRTRWEAAEALAVWRAHEQEVTGG